MFTARHGFLGALPRIQPGGQQGLTQPPDVGHVLAAHHGRGGSDELLGARPREAGRGRPDAREVVADVGRLREATMRSAEMDANSSSEVGNNRTTSSRWA